MALCDRKDCGLELVPGNCVVLITPGRGGEKRHYCDMDCLVRDYEQHMSAIMTEIQAQWREINREAQR